MEDSEILPESPVGAEEVLHRPEESSSFRRKSRDGASAVPVIMDYETERAVVAALMIEPACISTVLSIFGSVSANDLTSGKKIRSKETSTESLNKDVFRRQAAVIFYDRKLAVIYETILDLTEKGVAVDLLSISDSLEREKRLEQIGGQDFLLEVQSSVASTANIESWCHTLRDYAMLREMIRTCSASVDLCKNYSGSVKSLLDTVESEIYKVRNRFVQPEIKKLDVLIADTFEYFMNLIDRKIEPGIPTEYPDLDALIGGGLKPGEMIVLAARPSIGKTAMALNIVRNIIMKDIGGKRRHVVFFSLEMSGEQVAQRLLCTEAHVPLSSIMDRTLKPTDIQALSHAASRVKSANLEVDPTGGISVFELRAKARKIHDREKLDLIVIDYLQLMHSGEAGAADNRQVEVASISGGLKKLAKDLNLPVLVLAQLNRDLEKGQSEKSLPKLSHLRESGAIEQDADVVIFLHRNRNDTKESTNPEANKFGTDAKLIVEKNRNGKTGIAELKFFPALMEFRSVEHRFADSDKTM